MRRALDITEIARQHYALVYRFCARRIGVEAAADAAQETFVTAQGALRRYRGDSTLRTWLLGIAHNECRRVSRNRNLQPPPIELIDAVGEHRTESLVIDRHSLTEALNKLSDEHRDVVLMHEVDGLSYEEIARVLEVPSGTVKSRLHHALLNLRRSLQEGGER